VNLESMIMHERQLSSADADVIGSFEKHFAFLKSEPLVLYGIGTKTKVLIDYLDNYNIVGLMDKSTTGSIVYGKKVVSSNEIPGLTNHIVIICNYASTDIIYRRIASLEEQFGINIYHLNGTKPKDSFRQTESDYRTGRLHATYDDLKAAIERNDVISFDIFDTVLMRKCLLPSDIFHIMERRLREEFGFTDSFAEKRIEADKIAHIRYGSSCDIYAIYRIMAKELSFSHNDMDLVIRLERETEKEYLLRRDAVVDAMSFAKSLNKVIVLTSDIYWPREFIEQLLADNEIKDYDLLAVSCDLKKSKYHGELWEYYRESYEGKQILHIGDDDFSDIRQASGYGINTFKVHAGYDLLNMSTLGELVTKVETIDDRLLLGRTVASLFNNPFALSASFKLSVDDFFLVGYAFFGPLVLNFMIWLMNMCSELKIKRIFFLSRDCYVLEKIYRNHIAKSQSEFFPKGQYFYASRRALSVSSIRNTNDILSVYRLAPYVTRITFGQFLYATFGLHADEDDPYDGQFLYGLNPNELPSHIIEKYSDRILELAEKEREYYKKYFSSFFIDPSETIGIVNFVSSGITQHFFEKVFDHRNLEFLYFQTRVEFGDIGTRSEYHALYGRNVSPCTNSSNELAKHYLTAESIFSAPDEQFIRFSSDGTPAFEPVDGKREFAGIARCHDGIEQFFADVADRDPQMLSRCYNEELIDAILGSLFSSEKCNLADGIAADLIIRDGFSPDNVVRTLSES
jgi:FMN phosphatase YigB (HAD superfamily)